MAIKTFKCVICEAEVTKPQSYAYKDGRACRHHPEVQQNHEVQEQAKKADLEKHKEALNKPFRGYKGFDENDSSMQNLLAHYGMKNPNEHCWCCHKDGIYEHIIMERYLINLSKAELKSDEPIPVFEVVDDKIIGNRQIQEALKNELGTDKVSLRRIQVDSEYPDWKLNQVINANRKDDKKQLVRITGMIVLCKECAIKYEFPWEYVRDTMSLEQMSFIGHLVKPVVDSLAAKEIASEEITSIMNK